MTQNIISGKTVKFLFSYGGKILPRPTDGKLRYVGGVTRVLSVDHSISYAELMMKFGESCGSSMTLKCKLPTEDLDVLVSIKSDEELRFVIEQYERTSPESKIRAVLFPTNPVKKASQPSSPVSCFDFPSVSKSSAAAANPPRYHSVPPCHAGRRRTAPVVGYPVATGVAAKRFCGDASSSRHLYNAAHRILTH